MKSLRVPALVLGCLYLIFIAALLYSAQQLPAQVGSHFGWNGQADGWMSRSDYLVFMAVFGLVFPLLVPTICFFIRFTPDAMVNLPHRDYWLAPEHRAETHSRLLRHALWFSSMTAVFVTAIHLLALQANRVTPPRMSTSGVLVLTGGFVTATLSWVVSMIRQFAQTPNMGQG